MTHLETPRRLHGRVHRGRPRSSLGYSASRPDPFIVRSAAPPRPPICLFKRRSSVMEVQIDVESVELAQERHQLLQAAAQPIDDPGHHDIDLPPEGISQHRIVGRPLVPAFGAADAVILVDVHDLPAGTLGNRA